MTPFFRQSITRALCASAWGLPGALWWASPVAASQADTSWMIALPLEGWRCGNSSPGEEFRRGLSMRGAMARGEYTDSLRSIAANRRRPAKTRDKARELLALAGQPLAPLPPSPPAIQLPPLIVRP